MPRRPTLQDVADACGVSRATASLVLAGRQARISGSTTARVRAAAADLGYRPNRLAHSLASARTQTLALVTDALASDPFTGRFVQAATTAARDRGHLLFVAETGGDEAVEQEVLRRLLDQGVDGYVLAPAQRREIRVPPDLAGERVVLLNATPAPAEAAEPAQPRSGAADAPTPPTAVAAVVPDDAQAGRLVARALLEAGHTTGIRLVGETVPGGPGGLERRDALRAELAAHGLALHGHDGVPWWPGPVRDALEPVLGGPHRPTAVVALNDRAALGVYEAAARRRLDVPRDLSVVSFDDSFLARWLDPVLASAALPYEAMGTLAVELLLDARASPGPTCTARVPFTLADAGSLGPPPSVP